MKTTDDVVYRTILDLYSEIELYRESLKELRIRFLECAQYDPMMEGPKFKAWNLSSLNRLRIELENEDGGTKS